ncbi:MAG: hypothetical protein IJQ55_02775 [Alphaproteobacteria bacterium]|nr:hypothetical protein [Alphaproteobacteria bacterium]
MYTPKTVLNNQIEKENKFVSPMRNFFDDPKEYTNFNNEFIKSDYDYVRYQNREKIGKTTDKPLKNILKNIKMVDYVIVLGVALVLGTITYSATNYYLSPKKIANQQIRQIDIALITTLVVLLSLVMGIGSFVMTYREKDRSEVEKVYNRLTMRLFDAFKKIDSSLDKDLFEKCNPDMAQVITALLIANMKDADVKELTKLANKISKQIEGSPDFTLKEYTAEMKQALNIITNALIKNPDLCAAISSTFKGNMPMTINLSKQKIQKQK